jgi:hypothetical protein
VFQIVQIWVVYHFNFVIPNTFASLSAGSDFFRKAKKIRRGGLFAFGSSASSQ